VERPKAEALGYLDATTNGKDNGNSNGNGNGKDDSRSLRDDKQKDRQQQLRWNGEMKAMVAGGSLKGVGLRRLQF
jgi:hypothetical protein